ncbi:hypothetical protein [Rhizobium sp. R339]|uniref:hypothetical protein n=1 Tax=Rhizobium sp. R339 TaxID=1764273 RepID=UPI001131BA41|nr:hypothetical protein [Rhizobium sp. R339]
MSSNVEPLELRASQRVPVEVKEVIDDEVIKDVIDEGTFPSTLGSAAVSETNSSMEWAQE